MEEGLRITKSSEGAKGRIFKKENVVEVAWFYPGFTNLCDKRGRFL